MKKNNRSLIIIRHAHRDTADRALDNGLSAKGKSQVSGLVTLSLKRFSEELRKDLDFFSSPKRRCTETLAPICAKQKAKLSLDSLLLECQPRESQAVYERRVRLWCDRWKKSGNLITVICSHGDWIPIAVRVLTGGEVTVKKGSWIEVRGEGKEFKIYSVIQDARRNY